VGFLNWSRDGNWIYFPSRRTGLTQTWKVPVAGGEPVQISRNGGWAARESADGKFVYFLKEGAPMRLWRAPVGGGEEGLVTDRLGGQLDFLDRGIYFHTRRPPGATSLHFFSFETGAAATIAEISAPVNTFTVSPDQRTLVYAQQEFRGADLMLVDNFR
jgi:phage baseplate assembly protein gpV